MIFFEAILLSGTYRNLLKIIMLRERRRNVNFKPNRRQMLALNKGKPQRLTGRQKLELKRKKGTRECLEEMLPACKPFLNVCKQILNLHGRHQWKGVWRQRRCVRRRRRLDTGLLALDAKSSRSVMYENEELRLRTININAEIERGQSDIKKLKKENEQLRREIWTLRDEYDKLEKLLASKVNLDCDDETNETDSCHSHESDGSCQTCGSCNNNEINDISQQHNASGKLKKEKHHVEFDHLSIVSEESQRSPNDERGQSTIDNKQQQKQQEAPDSPFGLSEIQALVPPLTHFESIQYDNIGPGNVDENGFIIASNGTEDTAQQWSSNKPDILLQQSSSVQLSPSEPVSSYRTFQTGGNLDELLQDIELLSKDIEDLQVQNKNKSDTSLDQTRKKPFKSEVSLFLDYPGNTCNGSSTTQIETQPIIHPVPPDDKLLPSPPILKDQRASTGFEHSYMNGSATMELKPSSTFEPEKKLSASESTLTKTKSAKRVSLSLAGKKPKMKKHDSIEKATHSRRMSLDLDLSPTHITHHQSDSRRHSCDSNKSHHKKRSRSDSINSRCTYTGEGSGSQRRMSITSYQSSKKIPWCGCWGLC